MHADPATLFRGVVALIAPHMDDEVLGCGATIARMPHKEQFHVIYATDGSRSSLPPARWLGTASTDLTDVRMAEARTAMHTLGVSNKNVHFLSFPDSRLGGHLQEFRQQLSALLHVIEPSYLLVPFHYDRHPDHLAVNRAATSLRLVGDCKAELFEYFVYSSWRLLPKQDIRRYVSPIHLFKVDIQAEAPLKRQALDCFKSQTTRFYQWQHRPNLTEALLDQVCRVPEVFLRYNPSFPDDLIFARANTWIRIVHQVEPALKRGKDRIVAFLHSMH
jgi:LmbE family N-acetylglucosaminyl deacetylase